MWNMRACMRWTWFKLRISCGNWLGVILEVYIDDIVIKSAGLGNHLADLRLALERMRRYGLKMNPLKCAFGVLAGKFLGFIIYEKGMEIDPKRVDAMKRVDAPTCKKDLQKFLGKVNYLSGKIDFFTPILQLKDEAEFTWGQNSKSHLRRLRITCLRHRCLRRQGEGLLLGFMWLQKIRLLVLF